MNTILINHFEALETTTKKFLAIIKEHSPEQQQFRPSDQAWNMLDVAEHLLNSETGINSFFKKYPPAESTRSIQFSNRIKAWLIQLFLVLPTKVRAVARVHPSKEKKVLTELENKWQKQRQILKPILISFPKEKRNISVFKHPLSGPMNMENVVKFMDNHIKHHIFQLNRIRKHSNFPKI